MGDAHLQVKNLIFHQDPSVFKIGTDSLLLAKFLNAKGANHAMDLGTGTGVLSILLAKAQKHTQVTAIDISSQAISLAKENIEANKLSQQIVPQKMDIRHLRDHFPANSFDFVMTNPPYFPQHAGKRAQGAVGDAREEALCTLSDICKGAAYLLRYGGNFALVHRPQRLAEICSTMSLHGIEPKRIAFALKDPLKPPSLVFIEGKRGAKPGLLFEAPFLLDGKGMVTSF